MPTSGFAAQRLEPMFSSRGPQKQSTARTRSTRNALLPIRPQWKRRIERNISGRPREAQEHEVGSFRRNGIGAWLQILRPDGYRYQERGHRNPEPPSGMDDFHSPRR